MGTLLKLAKEKLDKFGERIADIVASESLTTVQRDVITGDVGAVKAPAFALTPFKTAIKASIAKKVKEGATPRIPKETLAKAAAVFQNELQSAFTEVSKSPKNHKKGAWTVITSEALGGPVSERSLKREAKKRAREEKNQVKKGSKEKPETKASAKQKVNGEEKKKEQKTENKSDKEETEWSDAVKVTKPKKTPSRKEIMRKALEIELKEKASKRKAVASDDGEEESQPKKIRRRSSKPSLKAQLEAMAKEMEQLRQEKKSGSDQEAKEKEQRKLSICSNICRQPMTPGDSLMIL